MNEDMIEWLEQHERPFATAPELADAMGVENSAIHKRLRKLIDSGKIDRKKVGASAVVYWLPERVED